MTEEVLARLKDLAVRIIKTDETGLHHRWQFGCELLPLRGTKRKLPDGTLAEIAKQTRLQPREIQNYLKFAERYPTRGECVMAITQYPSWFAMVHEGLYNKKTKADDARKDDSPLQRTDVKTLALGEDLLDANPEMDDAEDDESDEPSHDGDDGQTEEDRHAHRVLAMLEVIDVVVLSDPGAFVERLRNILARHEHSANFARTSRFAGLLAPATEQTQEGGR